MRILLLVKTNGLRILLHDCLAARQTYYGAPAPIGVGLIVFLRASSVQAPHCKLHLLQPRESLSHSQSKETKKRPSCREENTRPSSNGREAEVQWAVAPPGTAQVRSRGDPAPSWRTKATAPRRSTSGESNSAPFQRCAAAYHASDGRGVR
jgi:hypothetical protein